MNHDGIGMNSIKLTDSHTISLFLAFTLNFCVFARTLANIHSAQTLASVCCKKYTKATKKPYKNNDMSNNTFCLICVQWAQWNDARMCANENKNETDDRWRLWILFVDYVYNECECQRQYLFFGIRWKLTQSMYCYGFLMASSDCLRFMLCLTTRSAS